jgi:membrane fusion protein (multidrug efflux system)
MVVDKESKVELRMITVDRALGDKWLITSGLNAGDTLIVEGTQKVRPGIPVKAVPVNTGNKEDQSVSKTGPTPAKAK